MCLISRCTAITTTKEKKAIKNNIKANWKKLEKGDLITNLQLKYNTNTTKTKYFHKNPEATKIFASENTQWKNWEQKKFVTLDWSWADLKFA